MSADVVAGEAGKTSSVAPASTAMGFIVLLGRVLFAAIFVMGSFGRFKSGTVGYAASQGVPMASVLVPVSGVIALAGGLSILLGFKARLGAWLIVIFLVPVTFMMHAFWAVTDPMAAQMQQIMFLQNVSMLGGALLVSQLGAGPWSLDARGG
jgi:putative oxidoreductase